ncbi:MFS transporter [Ammoniphilus sp. 3BR4]|uniref:MFS transporter n=1 Tax=Ammoniphilus sp. 3BR4 TaxID=3158265 RepID=UPI003466F88F
MFKKNYRWAIMWFISLLMIINFLDRIVISVATEPIMSEFGFTATQWGVILSAFFWGLVPFSFLAGIGADKYGPKKIWLWGVTVWSIFTMGTATAWNYVSFLIARIFFGVGEGPTMSNGIRIITNWMSPKEYSSAYGIAFGGVYLGPALGAPIIVWMISQYGWRVPFYVLGIFGILWVVGWLKWFTDRPELNKYMSDEEKSWIRSEQGDSAPQTSTKGKNSLRDLLAIPKEVRGTIVANWWAAFCFGYALYFLMTWLPGYLNIQRGLSLQSMGFALMFPWLGAAFGMMVGGRISDGLFKWTGSKRVARAYWAAGWFAVVVVSLTMVVRVESAVHAIILLTIAGLANACAGGTVGPVIADTVPKQAGSQAGVLQVFQTLPGIFAPIITGYIVDTTQSFDNAFYFAAILVASGVVTTLLFLRPPSVQKTAISEEPPMFVANH